MLSAKMHPGFEKVICMLLRRENEGAQDGLWELQHRETQKANNLQHLALSGPAQAKDRRMFTAPKFHTSASLWS